MPRSTHAPRQSARLSQPRPAFLTILLLAGAFILLAALAAGGLLAVYARSGPIVPGVAVGQVEVGGLSLLQAADRIDREWNQERSILVRLGGQNIVLPPSALGLSVDSQASARLAWQAQRAESAAQLVLAAMRPQQVTLTPYVEYDPDAARLSLQRLAASLAVPAQDARIEFRDGHFIAVPSRPGQALDEVVALETLARDPAAVLFAGQLDLPLRDIAPAVPDLSAEAAALEARLSLPLAVSAFDPISGERWEWTLSGADLSAAVQVDLSQGAASFRLDEAAVDRWLQDQAAGLGGGRAAVWRDDLAQVTQAWEEGRPLRAELRHPAGSYVVEAGDTLMKIAWKVGVPYWRIQQANPDAGALSTGQALTIPSKNDLLPLPVVWGKRIVINITEQRMRLYENGALLAEHVISTGMDDSPTQPGVFQIQTHELSAYASNWDLTMPHFMGIYEAWPGFMNGIHGLPTLSSGRLLWAGALGRPASYGCVILSLEAAEQLFGWAEAGVVVEIQP